jgi:hypothetical protein
MIALMITLRDSEEQRRFISSVVIDNSSHLPAFETIGLYHPHDETVFPETRMKARHMVFSLLGQSAKNAISIQPSEREDAIAAEFFEYKLLYDMAVSQRSSDNKEYSGGTDSQSAHRIRTKIRRNILPPDAVRIGWETLQGWLEGNRLIKAGVEPPMFKFDSMLLPKGATLRLSSQVVAGIPERVIYLEVPDILTASFQIQGLGTPGFGILPPAVVVDKEKLDQFQTYGIDVTMKVHYKWTTAASPKMPAYKQWISSLFMRLEDLNADY